MLFDISLDGEICLIWFFSISLNWISFICVYVISDVFFFFFITIEDKNVKFQVTFESSNCRQPAVISLRSQNFCPPPTIQKPQRTHHRKPYELPQTKLLLLSTMHNLTWPEQLKWRRVLCSNPTIVVFFFSIWGTNHRFRTLSFFPRLQLNCFGSSRLGLSPTLCEPF